MKAKSIKGKSTAEIKAALEESIADGYKATLAIVFISIKQDRKAVAALFHQKEIDILGVTSCGEFINGHQSEGEIVVLLLDLSRDASLFYLRKSVTEVFMMLRKNLHRLHCKNLATLQ